MNYIKNNIKYLLLFIFFTVILLFICFENTSFDFMWSYGFSHAIKTGEIPYLDFNTISTPLYIFIMSIFLFIKDSFVMFIIIQALFCTLLFYIIFKYIGKKGWLLLPILSFPFFVSFIGTYNFLAFFLIVLLFLLEDNKKSDYLIGFILGLLVLSKQTIGVVAILFNLFFLKDIKKIKKRIIGSIIPTTIFILYLILTKSLYAFVDLCFLGLFDFGSKNGGIKILTIISLSMLIYVFIYYFKYKDIKCSYLIAAFFFPFPIFDYSHFNLFLSLCIIAFISKVKLDEEKIVFSSLSLLTVIVMLNVYLKYDFYKDLVFLNLDHFENYLLQKKDAKDFHEIYNKYTDYSNSLMIGTQAMLFDVASNKKITYFDMPLTGNYGKRGTAGMIEKISQMHDKIIFINICNHEELKDKTQLDYEITKYVIKNSKKIDSILCYNIYYKG